MRAFKNIVCIMLALTMALLLCGCFRWGGKQPIPAKPTEAPTEAAVSPTGAADTPTEAPTKAPTEAPTEQPGADADELFAELDLEIFRDAVTASADVYNQSIIGDPARYGITEEDIPRGWGDYYDEQAHRDYMDTCREMLARLEGIDREALSERNQYAYDAIKRHYEMDLLTEDFYFYEEPLTPINGMQTALPLSMICFEIRTPKDAETYVMLLEDMPRVIDQIAEFEVGKAEHGLFMTETALEQVVESCENFAATGEDCFLIDYFDMIEERALEVGVTANECSALRERSNNAVLNGILPAYSRLAETLVDLTGDCSELVGAAELGDKRREYYDISVQRGGATMESLEKIIERVGEMGDNMLTEMIFAMYADPDALERYGEPISFGTVDDDMAWLAKFAAEYYPAMPDYEVKYVEIPEDLAEDFSPAAYLVPGYDEYHDNIILINPTSDNTTQLLTLAHEGIPGHMYQFLYFRDSEGLSLAQQALEGTGYAEGWTVFTEYFTAQNCTDIGESYCSMMNAESVYGNIFLPAYVSLKVNHEGWSKEETKTYLDSMQMGDYVDTLYEYAVTMPFYAMSYAVGFTYMYDLYLDNDAETPAQYKQYFEKLLSYGPTCLDLLEGYMGK